jgi:coatomer subunit beta
VFAIMSVYKYFEHLIPDAPELIATYLQQEQDPSCRRNAFVLLCNTDNARALSYLTSIYPQIPSLDEFMQLAIVDLIKKDCRVNFGAKGKYLQTIVALLSSASNAVKYEAAGALISLTSSPPAVREVGTCFINLAIRESDNNVKSIILERLSELNKDHERVLEDKVMDVLRVLGRFVEVIIIIVDTYAF